MSKQRKVEFFYDVLSPYSWIGFELLCRYRQNWNIKIEFQPIVLADILKETGNSSPGANPAKFVHLLTDVRRLVEYYELGEINFPDREKIDVMKMLADGVSAMKFLTAAKITHSDKMEDLSREFWKRIYKTHEEFGFSEGLHKVCEVVGINKNEAQKIIDESQKESIQVKLNETMKRAVDYGGFGVPTILVENPEDESKPEMFFGSDRYHLIARYLGVECHSPGSFKDH